MSPRRAAVPIDVKKLARIPYGGRHGKLGRAVTNSAFDAVVEARLSNWIKR